MDEVKYGESSDEICGILFDGAWLWEEYVNTILRKVGFVHPQNKLHKGGIYLFDDHTGIRYPDFYNNSLVLDAKYKRIGSYKNVSQVDNNDIHQIMAYMKRLHVDGGFIAPLENKQSKVPQVPLAESTDTISIFGIEINKTASSYVEFCEKMKEAEITFIESLNI
jgi:5-methylcytosine-specific restriction endonuclease McrBC regulatory subunit McrC